MSSPETANPKLITSVPGIEQPSDSAVNDLSPELIDTSPLNGTEENKDRKVVPLLAWEVVPHVTGREAIPIDPEDVGPMAIRQAQEGLPLGKTLVETDHGFEVVDTSSLPSRE